MENRTNELKDIIQAIATSSFEAGSLRATAVLRKQPESPKVKELHRMVSILSLAALSYYNETLTMDDRRSLEYLLQNGVLTTAEQEKHKHGKPLSSA